MLVALTREGVAVGSQPLTAKRFGPDNSGIGVLCPAALMPVYNVGERVHGIKHGAMAHVVLDETDYFRQWFCVIHIVPHIRILIPACQMEFAEIS
jgi:hypothetical protein